MAEKKKQQTGIMLVYKKDKNGNIIGVTQKKVPLNGSNKKKSK